MVTAFITIQVENFFEREKLFKANESIRKGLNIKDIGVFLLEEDAEILKLILEVESIELLNIIFSKTHQ